MQRSIEKTDAELQKDVMSELKYDIAIAVVAYALLSYLAVSLVRFMFYHES